MFPEAQKFVTKLSNTVEASRMSIHKMRFICNTWASMLWCGSWCSGVTVLAGPNQALIDLSSPPPAKQYSGMQISFRNSFICHLNKKCKVNYHGTSMCSTAVVQSLTTILMSVKGDRTWSNNWCWARYVTPAVEQSLDLILSRKSENVISSCFHSGHK